MQLLVAVVLAVMVMGEVAMGMMAVASEQGGYDSMRARRRKGNRRLSSHLALTIDKL